MSSKCLIKVKNWVIDVIEMKEEHNKLNIYKIINYS